MAKALSPSNRSQAGKGKRNKGAASNKTGKIFQHTVYSLEKERHLIRTIFFAIFKGFHFGKDLVSSQTPVENLVQIAEEVANLS